MNLKEILIDVNTFFNGLGVIGIIIGAVIGWLLNWGINKSKINADLKASTRLEWIKEVRELTATIIKEHNDYMKLLNIYNEKYKKLSTYEYYSEKKLKKEQNKLIENFIDESRVLIADTSKNRNLYKLYFAIIVKRKCWNPMRICGTYVEKNKENIEMHNLVDTVYNQIYNAESYFVNQHKVDNNIFKSATIHNFRNKTSKYLKREWDKAKRNK